MDEIANGTAADEHSDEPDLTWGHPTTLGVTAFVLAILSLLGASVFRGAAYTVGFAPKDNSVGDISSRGSGYVVVGAFLTAAFALIPVVLARNGLNRLIPSDGSRTGHLLRAALVLAVLSLLLHLVLAVVVLSLDPSTRGFYSVV